MGVEFGPNGIIKPDLLARLDEFLNIVKYSPTKPQQKLWLIKNNVIGRLIYPFPFCDLTIGNMNMLDVRIRKFIRNILHLPNDTPRAYFHAKVRDGGL